jgi:hypothetical protein
MAAWLPAVKVILPYLAQIVGAAIPVFTRKADRSGAEDVTRNQIAELQDAVTHNAESLKVLATQLQQAISDIDAASARIEREIKSTRALALLALILSLAAIILWLYTGTH